ncbi:hypothetical protein SLA2020_278310 [Shorea laevis]
MHEYRLCDSRKQPSKHMGSMRLDDWVLCRIYKKKPMAKTLEQREEESLSLSLPAQIDPSEQQQISKFPRTCSITHLLDMEYLGPISHLLCDNDNSYNSGFDFQNTFGNDEKPKLGEMPYQYMMDSGKFQVNPVYDFPSFDR